MPDKPEAFSFNLPKGEQLDVYVVLLADGSHVVRTAAELLKLPDKMRGPLVDLAPPKAGA